MQIFPSLNKAWSALLAQCLLQQANAYLTQKGEVTSLNGAWADKSVANHQWLVDGDWTTMAHSGEAATEQWFNVKLVHPMPIWTVIVQNREVSGTESETRIVTSKIRVGDDADPRNNAQCGFDVTGSAIVSCGDAAIDGAYVGIVQTRADA